MTVFVTENKMTSTDWMWSVVQAHLTWSVEDTIANLVGREASICMHGWAIDHLQSITCKNSNGLLLLVLPASAVSLCLSAQSERPIKRSNRKYRVLNKLRKRNGASLFIARHFARFLHLCTMVLKPHIHQRIVCLSLSPTVSITVISISRGACRKINKFVKLKPNKSSHQPTTRALVLAGWLAHWQVLFS